MSYEAPFCQLRRACNATTVRYDACARERKKKPCARCNSNSGHDTRTAVSTLMKASRRYTSTTSPPPPPREQFLPPVFHESPRPPHNMPFFVKPQAIVQTTLPPRPLPLHKNATRVRRRPAPFQRSRSTVTGRADSDAERTLAYAGATATIANKNKQKTHNHN